MDDTLIRSVHTARLSVAVGTVDPPPENWWNEALVEVWANMNFAGGTSLANPESGDTRLVSLGVLPPKMTPSATAPGEYVVSFDSPAYGFDSKGQRKGAGVTAYPSVYFGMKLLDPGVGVVGGFYASVRVTAWSFQEVLWGSINPT
jgi:hypothetical protein